MDDLTGVSHRGSWRRPLRLAGGLAVLLAGVLVLAAGTAKVGTDLFVGVGMAHPAASNLAFGIAALVPPLVVALVLVSVSAPRRSQRLGAAAIATAAVGVGIGLEFESVLFDRAAAFLYAIGFLFALLALADTFVADGTRSSSATSYRRETGARSRVTPADGGAEDEDLSFPLDDED